MSEQKQSFMEELDAWTEDNIFGLLVPVDEFGSWDADEERLDRVKKVVRTKVLESYRNGQAAGPAKPAAGQFRKAPHQTAGGRSQR